MTLRPLLFSSFLFFVFFSCPEAKEVPSHEVLTSYSSQPLIKPSDRFQRAKISLGTPDNEPSFLKETHFPKNHSLLQNLERDSLVQFAISKGPDTATDKEKQISPPTPKKTLETLETSEPVKPSQPDETVENVIHYLRLVSSGSPAQENRELQSFTALLLKDGRVFENEELAPSLFDPSKRPIGSKGTGRWQRDGEAYALAFSDGTEGTAVSIAAITSPAPPSMIVIGLFEETTLTPHPNLPHRLTFFKDGSLIQERPEQIPQSGRYKISLRSIEIEDDKGAHKSFLFGVHEPLEKPQLLIIGNKLYKRIEEEE